MNTGSQTEILERDADTGNATSWIERNTDGKLFHCTSDSDIGQEVDAAELAALRSGDNGGE